LASLKQFFHQESVEVQLAPLYIHRRNAAERAIRTFKNHFIAGLTATGNEFPLHLWNRLFPQAILTLNLLLRSQMNPKLSANVQVHGQFNFNTHPIGPPGTKVLIHDKAKNRASWAPHAAEGWYIGPALEHYRCYLIYSAKSRSAQIANTLTWFPTKVPFPFPNDSECLTAALNNIKTTLQMPTSDGAIPIANNTQSSKLQRLLTIFNQLESAPLSIEDTEPDACLSSPTNLKTDKPPTHTRWIIRSMATKSTNGQPTDQQWQTAALQASCGHTNTVLNTPLLRVVTMTSTPLTSTKARYIQAAMQLATEYSTPTINIGSNQWTETGYKDIHPNTGEAIEYKQLLTSLEAHLWTECCSEEIGRLVQGYKCVTGTNTIHFIKIQDMPPG
jgi:hypothetical protein